MNPNGKFRYYFGKRVRVYTMVRTQEGWPFELSLYWKPGRIVFNTTKRHLEVMWVFPWREFAVKCQTNQHQ